MEKCELVTLSTSNLRNLKSEFPEMYQDFFRHQKYKLWAMQKTKKKAEKLCSEILKKQLTPHNYNAVEQYDQDG